MVERRNMLTTIGRPALNALEMKYQAALRICELLDEWDVPFRPVLNKHYHYALEVNRIHVWCYWRPMTVSRYEEMTLNYEGPYIPVFASFFDYKNDEWAIGEGYNFNMRRNHRYRYVPFYFIVPYFLFHPRYPRERDWRWTPASQIGKNRMQIILTNEYENGGWNRNFRNKIQIPFKTGRSGIERKQEYASGWAKVGFDLNVSRTQEQRLLF